MPRKKKTTVTDEEAVPPFPIHRQIGELLQRRLDFWRRPDHTGRYPLPVLDFLVNAIGFAIELCEDTEELAKDAEFYSPSWYVKGITNGEWCCSLYRTIAGMAEQAKFPLLLTLGRRPASVRLHA